VFALLGISAGLLGVLFNRSLLGILNLFSRFKGNTIFYVTAIFGALAGLVGWFSPTAIGSGHALAQIVLAGRMTLVAIPAWFALRFFLTIGNYGTGTAGGIFAPLLVLGALLGLAVGQVAHYFAPEVVPIPAAFAVVGMAAYFTAIVRAPLTGTLLIVEMTGNYEQMLPLLVSCFCAYAVAEWLKDMPVYEALLERDLMRNQPSISLKEPMVIEMEIEKGSPFDGRRVRDLGLPPGCVLVRCFADGREAVPTATTRLEAHMKVTAVIASEAVDGLDILRQGCKVKNPGKPAEKNA
jgi:CIC family chloride channel protein